MRPTRATRQPLQRRARGAEPGQQARLGRPALRNDGQTVTTSCAIVTGSCEVVLRAGRAVSGLLSLPDNWGRCSGTAAVDLGQRATWGDLIERPNPVCGQPSGWWERIDEVRSFDGGTHMGSDDREAEFTAYVQARQRRFVRFAYLLTGDPQAPRTSSRAPSPRSTASGTRSTDHPRPTCARPSSTSTTSWWRRTWRHKEVTGSDLITYADPPAPGRPVRRQRPARAHPQPARQAAGGDHPALLRGPHRGPDR